MTPWIQIYSNLPEHPKIYQLADTLETGNYEAVGVVVSLWLWAAKNAPDGDLSRFPVRALGDAVGWRGDTKRLYQALVACGFIDQDGENTRLHDWEEYAVRLMEIIDRKKKKEQCRAKEYRRRKKLETPVEGEPAEQAESAVEEEPTVDSDTHTEEQSPCAEHLESSASRDASRDGNMTHHVTHHATVQPRHAPTGQDITPQDKTEQDSTQPPPGSGTGSGSAAVEKLIEEFRSRLGGLSPTAVKELRSFAKSMEPGVCLRALDIGCDNGHPKWAYVRAILNRWRQNGVKVLGDLRGRDAAPKMGNGSVNIPDNAIHVPQKPADGANCYSGVQGDPLGRKRLEAYLKSLRES